MVVVAIEHFYIDAFSGHPSRDLAELARLGLIQPLDQHFALGEHTDTGPFQRFASGQTVLEKEMRYAFTVRHPGTTAFDADARPS
jgi:hypothetical protein